MRNTGHRGRSALCNERVGNNIKAMGKIFSRQLGELSSNMHQLMLQKPGIAESQALLVDAHSPPDSADAYSGIFNTLPVHLAPVAVTQPMPVPAVSQPASFAAFPYKLGMLPPRNRRQGLLPRSIVFVLPRIHQYLVPRSMVPLTPCIYSLLLLPLCLYVPGMLPPRNTRQSLLPRSLLIVLPCTHHCLLPRILVPLTPCQYR